MRKLLDSVIQKASWKKTIFFTFLFAFFYALINFSGIGVAGLLNITNGANILDFEFGYTQEKAHSMLTALGIEGRDFYLTKILPFDFPFPLSYMLFYLGLTSLLLKHIASKTLFEYLLLIPIFAMLCDWIENIGIIAMLNNYPILPNWSVLLASVFGMFKFGFTIISIIIIAILFVIFAYSKFRRN